MNAINNSMEIIKQSLATMRKHPKLTVFPLINFVGMLFILVFFAMPWVLHTNVFSFKEDFGVFQQEMNQRNADHKTTVSFGLITMGDTSPDIPFIPLATLYLISMFVLTFVNVAFCSEILQAFNDNPVSIRRGLALAMTKLQAILVWSLLAGIVGIIIRKIEEQVGIVGRWIMALIGFSWSVTSVFAIPVIVREQQQSNPVAYLKTSAAIIKRTWGEGLVGVVGISVVVMFTLFALMIVGIVVTFAAPSPAFAVMAGIILVLCGVALTYLAGVARSIFLCGLYVYATEGVAPGSFSKDLMEQGWKVKNRK